MARIGQKLFHFRRDDISIIVAWILIMYFYGFITFWGMWDFFQEGATKDYLRSWGAHLEMIMGGLFFGFFFIIVGRLTDTPRMRRRSFGAIIVIKSLLYLISWSVTLTIIFTFFYFSGIVSEDAFWEFGTYSPFYFLSIISYWAFFTVLINFVLLVSRKFGPGNLTKLITGKYQNPSEEERVFLFLDLEGSTTIAEKLGHWKYSQMLTNCYHDLTDLVMHYKAEIYQYVGDEVVLTWHIRDGLHNLNCLRLFFAYEQKLRGENNFYAEQYNTQPEFKGGMDTGIVTVAEIGDIKREIAYHGDVLNTASRIQGQCKVLKHSLLISSRLERQIAWSNGLRREEVGEIRLRGKQKNVKIYSVETSNDTSPS